MRHNKAGTRRYRLVRLVSPVLRLVLSLLGGAPGSAKMVTEAFEFCRGQHKLLGRLLREATAPGKVKTPQQHAASTADGAVKRRRPSSHTASTADGISKPLQAGCLPLHAAIGGRTMSSCFIVPWA
jgi:hypothetical protein